MFGTTAAPQEAAVLACRPQHTLGLVLAHVPAPPGVPRNVLGLWTKQRLSKDPIHHTLSICQPTYHGDRVVEQNLAQRVDGVVSHELIQGGEPLLLHRTYVLPLVRPDTDVLGLVVVPEGPWEQ